MDDETRIPDFDWFTSDNLFAFSSPDDIWLSEWRGCPDLAKQLRGLLRVVIHSLEGLASRKTDLFRDFFKKWPDLWLWSVDWWYCKDAMDRIPQITKRFEKLSPILTQVTHRKEVNVYLREATQCYLYGFFQASTVLFRTALETGLRDFCERKLGSRPTGTDVNLDDLITQTVRFHLLSEEAGAMASRVRKTANKVVHDEPVSEEKAFDVLVQTRFVLEEIYQ
jgi:hypothetical protein